MRFADFHYLPLEATIENQQVVRIVCTSEPQVYALKIGYKNVCYSFCSTNAEHYANWPNRFS